MPLEGESYWIFVWTLGWGRPLEGESYFVFVWTLGEGGARSMDRWIDGSVGSVGSVGSIDPSSDRPIDLSIDLPI